MGDRFKINQRKTLSSGVNQKAKESQSSVLHLDEKDLALLKRLQRSAKTTNTQLAAEVGLSPAATLERVRKLESSGIIKSYHARLDPAEVGLPIQLVVQVRLRNIDPKSLDAFEKAVNAIPEVLEAYQTTGDSIILLKVLASDLNAFQIFLAEKLACLPMVESISSQVVLKTMKENSPLPIVIK